MMQQTTATSNWTAWVLTHDSAARRMIDLVEYWDKMSRYALFDQRFDRLASRYEELSVEEFRVAEGEEISFADVREIVRVAKIILG